MEPPPNETRRCFFAFAFALTDGKPRDIRRGFPSTPCPFGDTSELEASTSLPILVSEGFRLAIDEEGDSFTRDGGDVEVPFNESSIGRRRRRLSAARWELMDSTSRKSREFSKQVKHCWSC